MGDISVTIRAHGSTETGTVVRITGDGEIDTREEARAALAAVPAGQDASRMDYVVGATVRSYAEIAGTACLGRVPRFTAYASVDNHLLQNPGACLPRTAVALPAQVVDTGQPITVAGAQYMIVQAATPLALNQGADGVVGTVQSDQAGKRVSVSIDNSTGVALMLPIARTAVSITIPQAQLDALLVGPHAVSITPEGGSSHWNISFNVDAAAPATRFAADPTIEPAICSSRRSDTPALVVNTTDVVATGVMITVNGAPLSGFLGNLSRGVNRIPIRNTNIGSGRSHFNNNTRGAPAGSYQVVITIPGEAPRTVNLVIEGGGRPTVQPAPTRRRAPGGGSGR